MTWGVIMSNSVGVDGWLMATRWCDEYVVVQRSWGSMNSVWLGSNELRHVAGQALDGYVRSPSVCENCIQSCECGADRHTRLPHRQESLGVRAEILNYTSVYGWRVPYTSLYM